MYALFHSVATLFMLAAFIGGCAAKPPVLQNGKQVGFFVMSDRGIRSSMTEDERRDRNETGQFLEEDLIRELNREGYNATLVKERNQYIQSVSTYLIIVRIIDVRLAGRTSRTWLGYATGPTMLKNHYEVTGFSSKLSLSYDDDDSTTGDWTSSPHELNQRLIQKINNTLVGKTRTINNKPVGKPKKK